MLYLLLCLCGAGIVENGAAPVAPLKITLEKQWTLGGEDAEEDALFSGTTSVCALPDGSCYVLDSGNFRICRYDASGKLQHSFGRKGPGPGEFSEPVAMSRTPEGHLVIFDTGTHKIAEFQADGTFVREAPLPGNIHGVYQPAALPDGRVAMACMQIGASMQMSYAQILLDADYKEAGRFYTHELSVLDWQKADSPGFWVNFLAEQMDAVGRGWPLQVAVGPRLLTLRTHAYEGRFHQPDGKEDGGFTKTYKPRVADDAEKEAVLEPIYTSLAANPALSDSMSVSVFERALDQVASLERLPPVTGVAELSDGFVVLADYKPTTKTGNLDLFDANGRLQGQVPYTGPATFLAGAGDYLFAVGTDAADYVVVTRYHLGGRHP